MKPARIKLLPVFVTILVTVLLIGCGGGGGGSGSSTPAPDNDTILRSNLSEFNTAFASGYDSLKNIADAQATFAAAVAAAQAGGEDDLDDFKDLDGIWESFFSEVQKLEKSIVDMRTSDDNIQALTEASANRKSLTVIAGIGLYLFSAYNFSQRLGKYKKDLDESNAKINALDAKEKYAEIVDEKKKQTEIARKVITDITTSVISSTVTAPANPSTVGGVLFTNFLGEKVADGMKAISTVDNEKMVISESEGGKIHVASGAPVLLASDNKTARYLIDVSEDKTIASIPTLTDSKGVYTQITREEVPLAQATVKAIKENDAGELYPENTISLSYTEKARTSINVTYQVTARVKIVPRPTTIKIDVNRAITSDSEKPLSADGSVSWEVYVITGGGSVKVTRKDTGEWESIALPFEAETTPAPAPATTGFASNWLSDGSTTTAYNKLILTGPESSLSGTYEVKGSDGTSQKYDVANTSISGNSISIDFTIAGVSTTIMTMELKLSADTLSGQLSLSGISLPVSFSRQ